MAVLLLFSHQKNTSDKFIHNFGIEATFIPVSAKHAAAEDGDFGKHTVRFLIEKKHSFKKSATRFPSPAFH